VPLPAPLSLKKSDFDSEFCEWIMKEYDTDRDGKLEETEVSRLVDDIENWDIGKENVIKISDVTGWINKFDKNGDRKLSIDELIKALS
jgi:Ca2+-binding EF-hand superfamily protein